MILTGAFVRQGLYVEKNEPFRVTFSTTGMFFFRGGGGGSNMILLGLNTSPHLHIPLTYKTPYLQPTPTPLLPASLELLLISYCKSHEPVT